MVERLQRLERVFQRHPIYFLTAVTADRRAILADAFVRAAVEQFALAGPGHGAWLGGYVLMPDHLHAFVALDDQQLSLSTWMKSLKNALSKTLRTAGVAAPHWQKGFFDHLLRSTESYAEKWVYVRENPARAGFVARAEDWPYAGEPFPLELRPDGERLPA
jgi:REP element-mobilizing transposase RayT